MSAELMKSKFACLPSSIRSSSVCGIDYLWTHCMLFLQILDVACLVPYARTLPIRAKKIQKLLLLQIIATRFSNFPWMLTWEPVGVEISKCYSYKSQPKIFKLLPNFLLNGPPKITFEIFEVLKIEILTFFFHFRLHGGENLQNIPLLQIAAEHFQICPEFSHQWSTKAH